MIQGKKGKAGNKMNTKNKMNKKGIELEILAWWAMALGVLVLVLISLGILAGKGGSTIAFIQDVFRFGGT